MIVNQPGPAGESWATSVASTWGVIQPPGVNVPGNDPPVRRISPDGLRNLGQKLSFLWQQYRSDRRIAELRWLRNERQYLAVYDPEVDKQLMANRSRAYPGVTRVKCVSVWSRLMHLMFPGDERNWILEASPNANMSPKDVKQAIQEAQKRDQEANQSRPLDDDYVRTAVQQLADTRAEEFSKVIDDQLQEIGGDQTLDYEQLNRQVLKQGVIHGCGLLVGPYAREKKRTVWKMTPQGLPVVTTKTFYMPVFRFLRIWDFYPDMSAKTFDDMDGYFEREVLSRAQVKELGERPDMFPDQIDTYLANHEMGNYRPLEFEQELRAMGVTVNVNEMKVETSKYEIIIWRGKTMGNFLALAGIPVPPENRTKEIDAEIWTIDGNVIGAKLNPWVELGEEVKTLHWFLLDEDDTSPIGFGLPNILRNSQMSIAAATRMLMDNASVVCGPQLELNTDLLRPDQDLTTTSGYKIWYRQGIGMEAQWEAVRNVSINSHLTELQAIVEMFTKWADVESFVGPATGGDNEDAPSEPMRTAAGASMIRGEAALPFKDIVRSFDRFTQSVILSLVQFNRLLNKADTPESDFNVIARGATSLMAKELRAIQADQLVATMRDEEALHIDWRKVARMRLMVRDLGDLLVSQEEADRRLAAQQQAQAQQQQQQQRMVEAQIRSVLAEAFKNIAQGQKNSANANAQAVETALMLMEQGVNNALGGGAPQTGAGAGQPAAPDATTPGGANPATPGLAPDGAGGSSTGGLPSFGPGGPPGAGQGMARAA